MLAVLDTAPMSMGRPRNEKMVARRAIVFVFPHPGGPFMYVIF